MLSKAKSKAKSQARESGTGSRETVGTLSDIRTLSPQNPRAIRRAEMPRLQRKLQEAHYSCRYLSSHAMEFSSSLENGLDEHKPSLFGQRLLPAVKGHAANIP